jgi:hypothetical protein
LGYIDFLIKLLSNYSSVEHDTAEVNEFFCKITNAILNQIKLIIKLNAGRCEQFVHLDGLGVLNKLSNREQYDYTISPILAELILSTKHVREELKKINAFDLLINLMKDIKNKDNFPDIINSILFWLNDDKAYIENYLNHENNFENILTQMFKVFSLNDFLSILLKFFEVSEIAQNKILMGDKLVYDIMDSILASIFSDNKDIYLIIKIIDFLDYLVNNRKNDVQFFKDIRLYTIIDNTIKVSKENSFVILEEKIKQLNLKLNR